MSTKHTVKSGILLTIHPNTGDVLTFRKGEGELARMAILDGYEPVGPRGAAAAKIIRERAAQAKAEA